MLEAGTGMVFSTSEGGVVLQPDQKVGIGSVGKSDLKEQKRRTH